MQIKDYQVVLLGVVIALGSIFSSYVLSKSIVEFQKLQNQTTTKKTQKSHILGERETREMQKEKKKPNETAKQ